MSLENIQTQIVDPDSMASDYYEKLALGIEEINALFDAKGNPEDNLMSTEFYYIRYNILITD